jgi:hypothetical protein
MKNMFSLLFNNCVLSVFDTKSRLLLDFSRGAQRVSPVCCGLLLGYDGYAVSGETSLHTAESAMPPSFAVQSLISKGQWFEI